MMSSLVMRPFSPVPVTLVRSTPISRAMRRTLGPACTPEKSVCAATGCAPADTAGEVAAGVGPVPGGGVGGAAAAGAGSCCDSSDVGCCIAPSSLPARNTIGVPSLTRSPTFTST